MRKLLLLTLLCPVLSMCQPLSLKGKVINEAGEPIAGATITLKPNLLTVDPKTPLSSLIRHLSSNSGGEFSLTRLHLGDTIIFTAVGYEPETVVYDEGLVRYPELTVTLRRNTSVMDQVIVNTGYQSLPKERATGSFERIGSQLFNRRISTDLLSRLEGVSSLYFDRRGAGYNNITIRGQSTIYGNAAPLIVVDNFPYEGSLTNINPADVESVTLLKDAAAASIWGVRAANGVIVITTKKGQVSAAPRVEFSSAITFTQKPDLWYTPALSSADFIAVEQFLFSKGFYNGDMANTTNRPPLSPVVEMLARRRAGLASASDSASLIQAAAAQDVRHDFDRYFLRTGLTTQQALNISGGSNRFTWLLAAGFDNNNTTAVGNTAQKWTLRSQSTFFLLKNWRLEADINYAETRYRTNNPGTSLSVLGKKLYPYARLADENGSALAIAKDYRQAYLDTAGGGRLLDWNFRPLQELALANNGAATAAWRLAFGSTFLLSKSVRVEVRYQRVAETTERASRYGPDTYTARNLINRFYNPAAANRYPVPLGGLIDLAYSSSVAEAGRTQLSFNRQWGAEHSVNAIAGAEIRETHNGGNSYRVYGYSDEILTFRNVNFADNLPIYNNLGPLQPIPNPVSFSDQRYRFTSLYANAAYTWRRRYTASASGRKDASNLFGVAANQRGVPLWSVGAAWLLSSEDFYRWKALPFLRLRATLGITGNVDNALSALPVIQYTTNAALTGLPYAYLLNPPNPELQWEKTRTLNLALDLRSKNDRFEGTVEYYRKRGTDLIGLSPVDPTTGVQTPALVYAFKGNVAQMAGEGCELQLTANHLRGVWQWSTSLLFNYNRSWVTDYTGATASAGTYLNSGLTVNPIQGKPLYTIYSYQWAGLDPQTGDPRGLLNHSPSSNYTALANQPVETLVYHGSALPVTFGALRNDISWRSFSLSVNLVYKLGYYVRRNSISYSALFNNWEGHPDFLQRWQAPGDEGWTHVPSMVYPNPSSARDAFYSFSEVLVERGDHLRLQDLALSWRLVPGGKPLPFQSLRLNFYAANLGILWKAGKAGLDPDYPTGGFPLSKTLGLSLNAIF